jgi:hypothetical protein
VTDQRERWLDIAEELGTYDMETEGGWSPNSAMVRQDMSDGKHWMVGDYVEAEPACKRIAELESLLRASEEGEMVKGDRIKELEDTVADWVQSARRANGETCDRGTLGEFMDEKHCGCVGLLRKRIAELEAERDDLAEALRSTAEIVEALSLESSPQKLIELALSKGADAETLERLFALQERWEANQARKARQAQRPFWHATLEHIVAVAAPELVTSEEAVAWMKAKVKELNGEQSA